MRVEPPLYLFASLATIIVLHLFLPGAKIISAPWNLLGVLLVAVGIVLNLMADKSFKERETSVKPLEESARLVTTGVFRLSRHPMYLGFVLILLGAAVLSGSMTPFLVVLVFLVFMDTVFIRFEEKKLAQTFGDAWLDYTHLVRRWI
ncbi:MAG: isoprenylcysteine carboxylmethyltransferase family protein [Gammaproteobacteria bacterium]|nr:isoprenylcysteine carboxylmethyltransferase family protein [Thermoanaerobaculales bacterium]MCW9077859.1 isoprenylcysteine carboxylmethyltransferase family protein [Gammaproteobacteria bacterium]